MEEKLKIEPGSVQETLIIPLYGRKLCAEVFPKLYTDHGMGDPRLPAPRANSGNGRLHVRFLARS